MTQSNDWRSDLEYDGHHTPQGETLEPDMIGDVQPEEPDYPVDETTGAPF